MEHFNLVIVGTGPAGLGAAFTVMEQKPSARVLMLDKKSFSSGGLRNDCKMNFTFPIGFPLETWNQEQAEHYLDKTARILQPDFMTKENIEIYKKRAEKLDVELLSVEQTHLGTDGGLELIKELYKKLENAGVTFALGETAKGVDLSSSVIQTDGRSIEFDTLLIAPGRGGFTYLQDVMNAENIPYVDHIVDVGIRIETRIENYPIVRDYYDPKFIFPGKVRTFCTNSGNAHVVQERYTSRNGKVFYSINGHAWSAERGAENGLVNFAMLKTIRFTEPLASGQEYAENLGLQAMLMGGGKPIMQRVGDFRLGKRSKVATFNQDLYDFKPTLSGCTPGDISLAVPAKVLRGIWKSMKLLDTIVPGVLHPSTIMYYPEIKLYANKPEFADEHFRAADRMWFAGDGAGVSRGITAAWASGIRAAEGILKEI